MTSEFGTESFPVRVERGAAAVGRFDAMPDDEAWWVWALRLWCDGPQAQALFAQDVAARLRPGHGSAFIARFGDLMTLIQRHARRPLARHGAGCPCVGADEAVFALLCSTATHGEREDAMLIACLLLRPDVAPLAVSLAQSLGLDLARRARTTAETLH